MTTPFINLDRKFHDLTTTELEESAGFAEAEQFPRRRIDQADYLVPIPGDDRHVDLIHDLFKQLPSAVRARRKHDICLYRDNNETCLL